MPNSYGVFLGLDVGKGDHHAVGLTPSGDRLHDATLPNNEPKLREVFDRLARHGRVLVVVDQPATIGALPVTVARACGHEVAYLLTDRLTKWRASMFSIVMWPDSAAVDIGGRGCVLPSWCP